MTSKGSLRIERRKVLTEENRRVIESSYSGQEITQVDMQLNDAEYFLVAKTNAREVGALAIKVKLKEKPYIYVVCLATLSGKFWEDAILRLIQGAKDYAAEKGFRDLYIVESREPYIELLKRIGFEPMEESHVLAMNMASIPSPRLKSQVDIKRIPGDVRTFVGAWNHIVGSGSPGDFPDFPPITEDYIEGKLQRDYSVMNPEVWFIALLGDEPCGLITVSRNGDLGDLMVSKSHRRKGIGTALVIEALKDLRSKGFERTTLRVREGNTEAIKFYFSLGFSFIGREIDMMTIIPDRYSTSKA